LTKELIVNAGLQETRAALLEDGLLAEIFIERCDHPSLLGNVYLGRVSNVLPGMQSAFVDIGLDRDAFLYVADLVPPENAEEGLPEVRRPVPGIESLLKSGQDLLVQVVKEPLGRKGPRVTAQLSLPGRRLVFLPGGKGRMVSRRVEPEAEKERLRQLAEGIPGEGGFILRTAAAGMSLPELQQDAEDLRRRWSQILGRTSGASVPVCLHREADLPVRVLRDLLTESVDRVLVDDAGTLERCRDYARLSVPHLVPRIERYDRSDPVFDFFGIEKEILKALRRRVWLASGGYLLIHPTEALVAIDVNTGKFVGSTDFEETALLTNLEAAREIVRQIRLRDLGGILVIDFIDMPSLEHRRQLAETLEQALKSDRARSRVLQISEFGLVEITRQRIRQGLEGTMCGPCPTCRGSGRLKNPATMRLEILRELKKIAALSPRSSFRLRVHPEVAASIQANWAVFLQESGRAAEGEVQIESAAELHPEEFEVLPT
jgi:ribonuclease G